MAIFRTSPREPGQADLRRFDGRRLGPLPPQPSGFLPRPEPAAPDLILRTFQIPNTTATHVKFVVANNQCTGNPNFQGDQHDDPTSPTSDCRPKSVGSDEVRAAELQLLTSKPQVDGATLVD